MVRQRRLADVCRTALSSSRSRSSWMGRSTLSLISPRLRSWISAWRSASSASRQSRSCSERCCRIQAHGRQPERERQEQYAKEQGVVLHHPDPGQESRAGRDGQERTQQHREHAAHAQHLLAGEAEAPPFGCEDPEDPSCDGPAVRRRTSQLSVRSTSPLIWSAFDSI
jgi:hypothetical protein